jgi:large subunit ribosomal protein L19
MATIEQKDDLKFIESLHRKETVPSLRVGDTVKLGVLIQEGAKQRTQFYQGIIINKENAGINLAITVRKVIQGIGIEKKFLVHSPLLQSIEVLKSAKIRRAKLYYLRNLSGKAARLKQKFN